MTTNSPVVLMLRRVSFAPPPGAASMVSASIGGSVELEPVLRIRAPSLTSPGA
ncbi:hypothetical protein ACFVW2_24665 [Streptomyces sp. NPDC058171]